jgi:hypothetical protein
LKSQVFWEPENDEGRFVDFYLSGISTSLPLRLVGWVKRDVGTIYVGFAYLNASQKFELATKLVNPTILVADRRLNPTYDNQASIET